MRSQYVPVIDHIVEAQVILWLGTDRDYGLLGNNDMIHVYVLMPNPPEAEPVLGRFRVSIREMIGDTQHQAFPSCPTDVDGFLAIGCDEKKKIFKKKLDELTPFDRRFVEGQQTFSYTFTSKNSTTAKYPLFWRKNLFHKKELRPQYESGMHIDCEMVFTIRTELPPLRIDRHQTEKRNVEYPLIGDSECNASIVQHGDAINPDIEIYYHSKFRLPNWDYFTKNKKIVTEIQDTSMTAVEVLATLKYLYYKLVPCENEEALLRKASDLKLEALQKQCSERVAYKMFEEYITTKIFRRIYTDDQTEFEQHFKTPSIWLNNIRFCDVNRNEAAINKHVNEFMKNCFARNTLPKVSKRFLQTSDSDDSKTNKKSTATQTNEPVDQASQTNDQPPIAEVDRMPTTPSTSYSLATRIQHIHEIFGISTWETLNSDLIESDESSNPSDSRPPSLSPSSISSGRKQSSDDSIENTFGPPNMTIPPRVRPSELFLANISAPGPREATSSRSPSYEMESFRSGPLNEYGDNVDLSRDASMSDLKSFDVLDEPAPSPKEGSEVDI